MTYWPVWAVGLAFAGVPVLHWLLLRRMFAVSGRISAINDRLRERLSGEPPVEEMSQEDLVAALRAATVAAFGEGACIGEAASGPSCAGDLAAPTDGTAAAPSPPRQGVAAHVGFLLAITAGAASSAALAGTLRRDRLLAMDPGFERVFGTRPLVHAAVLLGGGLLVGFGTRMAAGCSSGHGLCGSSRFQPGSLVATACFFGTAVAVSLLLGS